MDYLSVHNGPRLRVSASVCFFVRNREESDGERMCDIIVLANGVFLQIKWCLLEMMALCANNESESGIVAFLHGLTCICTDMWL